MALCATCSIVTTNVIAALNSWPTGFWTMTSPRAAERLAFDAAAAVGAPIVNVGADFLLRGFPASRMIDRFAALCRRAADRGRSLQH